jgi:hypothetical protein
LESKRIGLNKVERSTMMKCIRLSLFLWMSIRKLGIFLKTDAVLRER